MVRDIDKWKNPPKPFGRPSGMDYIYARPGFLLRRCHQISVSIFLEACAGVELTPAQFGVLYAVRENPGLDQVAVARLIGLDRSTVSNVVNRLVGRGLVHRQHQSSDRRRRCLTIAKQGVALLARAFEAAAEAQARLLAPLDTVERQQLVGLLRKLMDTHAGRSRVPLDPEVIKERMSA